MAYGLRILPPVSGALGIDPVSLSGVPGPVIKVRPISSLDATTSPTDANALLAVNAINGTSTSDLILGTTVHDGTLTGNPGVLADDFDLTDYASCDNASVVKTVFPTPVTTIFIIERGANDKGFFQPIDAQGKPIGGRVDFAPADQSKWTFPAVPGSWTVGGMAITSDIPV